MNKIMIPLSLHPTEIKITFIRAPGPGGQNVNKVASAAQLRFNVRHSPSLPENVRLRLLSILGKKITSQGDVIIKASRYRTQERNKQDALNRLQQLLIRAMTPPKKRKKTKPTFSSIERRLTKKKKLGGTKALRRAKIEHDY